MQHNNETSEGERLPPPFNRFKSGWQAVSDALKQIVELQQRQNQFSESLLEDMKVLKEECKSIREVQLSQERNLALMSNVLKILSKIIYASLAVLGLISFDSDVQKLILQIFMKN